MRVFPTHSLKTERITTSPGVYFFLGSKDQILYIGKAANLRLRIRSYFASSQQEKMGRLLSEAKRLKVEPTDSEVSALLREAEFIKKVQPKFNVLWRDDKNYFYVGISNEEFPRLFITHQPKLGDKKRKRRASGVEYLGPFVSGRALKNTLKLVRSVFPYCTCQKPHFRQCLSLQLGNCPGFCCQIGARPTKEAREEYRRAIRNIKAILRGQSKKLQRDLHLGIKERVKRLDFEGAARFKRDLESIEKIFSHRGVLESIQLPENGKTELLAEAISYLLGVKPPQRIEMYDISMISGKDAVGAMVVFEDGKPARGSWRLFRVQHAKSTNDPGMIGEIVSRRFRHPEWGRPDLIIVDGGKAQLNAAKTALKKSALAIPLAAIAKGETRKNDRLLFGAPLKIIPFPKLPQELRLFFTRIRDETHASAIRYHRKRRRGSLFAKDQLVDF